MAKSLFKKKSFWQKLPQSSKVGLIAFVVVLVGAIAAFVLSQTDSSLQSKASLTCEGQCSSACTSITDAAQRKSCIVSCNQKCAPSDSLPPICKPMAKYAALTEKKGGLTKFQLNTVVSVAKRLGESVDKFKKSDDFAVWYKNRCTPQKCQPDWTKVLSRQARTVSSDEKAKIMAERNPTTTTYYWPNGCKGLPADSGKMCTQATVPLSTEEVSADLAWVKAGKQPITFVCGSTPCTPLPSNCNTDATRCKLAGNVNWCAKSPYPTPMSDVVGPNPANTTTDGPIPGGG